MPNEPMVAAASERAPAVLVVHEWFGLNDYIRDTCRRFAAEGIHALAVDVFGGQSTTDPKVAMALVQAMQMPDAVAIVAAATKQLLSDPRCNGQVFVAGFCMGGAVALAASCFVPELAGAIPFYGVPPATRVDWPRRTVPVLGHYGKDDHSIPVAKVEAMTLAARVSSPPFNVAYYDAGHAFMRHTDASAYVPEAAAVAWARTLTFMRPVT